MFWGVLGRSGLLYDQLGVLAWSEMFWGVLVCSGVLWGVL